MEDDGEEEEENEDDNEDDEYDYDYWPQYPVEEPLEEYEDDDDQLYEEEEEEEEVGKDQEEEENDRANLVVVHEEAEADEEDRLEEEQPGEEEEEEEDVNEEYETDEDEKKKRRRKHKLRNYAKKRYFRFPLVSRKGIKARKRKRKKIRPRNRQIRLEDMGQRNEHNINADEDEDEENQQALNFGEHAGGADEEEEATTTTAAPTTTTTEETTTTTSTTTTTTTFTTTSTEGTTITTEETTTTTTTTTTTSSGKKNVVAERESEDEEEYDDESDESDDSESSKYRVEEVVPSPSSGSVSNEALVGGCISSVVVCGAIVSFMLYWGKRSRRGQNQQCGASSRRDIEANRYTQSRNGANGGNIGRGDLGTNNNDGNRREPVGRLDGETDEEFQARVRQMMRRLMFLLDRQVEMNRVNAFTAAYRRQIGITAEAWAARRRRREELGQVQPLDLLPALPAPPRQLPSARPSTVQRPTRPPPPPPLASPAAPASLPTTRDVTSPSVEVISPAPRALPTPAPPAPLHLAVPPPSTPPEPVSSPGSDAAPASATSSPTTLAPSPPVLPVSAPRSASSASPQSSSCSSGDGQTLTTTAMIHAAPESPARVERPSLRTRRFLARRRAENRHRRRHIIRANVLESIVEEREPSNSTVTSASSASTTPSLPPRFVLSPVPPPRPPLLRNRSISLPETHLELPEAEPPRELSRSAPRLTLTKKKRPEESEQILAVLSTSAPDLHDLDEAVRETQFVSRSDETGKKKHKSRLERLKRFMPHQNDRLKKWFRSLFPSEKRLNDQNIGNLHSNTSIVSAPDILSSLALENRSPAPAPSSRNDMPPTPPTVSLMTHYHRMRQQEEKEKGRKKSIVIELSTKEQKILAQEFAHKGALNGRPPSHTIYKVATNNAKGKIQKKKRAKAASEGSHNMTLRGRGRSTSCQK